MDRLWAGWRTAYVEGVSSGPPEECVLCRIVAGGPPGEETHVLHRHRGGLAVAVLNAYPYGSGHLMVMPTRHLASPEDLSGEEATAVWAMATDAVIAVRSAYRPDGVNMGANLGRAAGAGIPDHFHLHVLPRWTGDTNFMTSVAETRVLPESLDRSAEKLRAAWPS